LPNARKTRDSILIRSEESRTPTRSEIFNDKARRERPGSIFNSIDTHRPESNQTPLRVVFHYSGICARHDEALVLLYNRYQRVYYRVSRIKPDKTVHEKRAGSSVDVIK